MEAFLQYELKTKQMKQEQLTVEFSRNWEAT